MKFQFKEGGSPEDDLDNLLSLILEILPSMEEKTFSPVERLPLRLPKTAREKHLNLIEEKFPKKIICRELRVLGTDILDRFCYSNPLSKLMTNLPTNAFIMEFEPVSCTLKTLNNFKEVDLGGYNLTENNSLEFIFFRQLSLMSFIIKNQKLLYY
jgi:hypothetical protein